ncbi:MAG: hypothetical protein ACYCPS_06240, partial [Candidatus Saccharimonadales bacterium]
DPEAPDTISDAFFASLLPTNPDLGVSLDTVRGNLDITERRIDDIREIRHRIRRLEAMIGSHAFAVYLAERLKPDLLCRPEAWQSMISDLKNHSIIREALARRLEEGISRVVLGSQVGSIKRTLPMHRSRLNNVLAIVHSCAENSLSTGRFVFSLVSSGILGDPCETDSDDVSAIAHVARIINGRTILVRRLWEIYDFILQIDERGRTWMTQLKRLVSEVLDSIQDQGEEDAQEMVRKTRKAVRIREEEGEEGEGAVKTSERPLGQGASAAKALDEDSTPENPTPETFAAETGQSSIEQIRRVVVSLIWITKNRSDVLVMLSAYFRSHFSAEEVRQMEWLVFFFKSGHKYGDMKGPAREVATRKKEAEVASLRAEVAALVKTASGNRDRLGHDGSSPSAHGLYPSWLDHKGEMSLELKRNALRDAETRLRILSNHAFRPTPWMDAHIRGDRSHGVSVFRKSTLFVQPLLFKRFFRDSQLTAPGIVPPPCPDRASFLRSVARSLFQMARSALPELGDVDAASKNGAEAAVSERPSLDARVRFMCENFSKSVTAMEEGLYGYEGPQLGLPTETPFRDIAHSSKLRFGNEIDDVVRAILRYMAADEDVVEGAEQAPVEYHEAEDSSDSEEEEEAEEGEEEEEEEEGGGQGDQLDAF